jgi:hypothetical protein
MMEWQPIETAPKDGTEILTYREAGLMAVAVWDPFWKGWICVDGAALMAVTHWQPLPEPPR